MSISVGFAKPDNFGFIRNAGEDFVDGSTQNGLTGRLAIASTDVQSFLKKEKIAGF